MYIGSHSICLQHLKQLRLWARMLWLCSGLCWVKHGSFLEIVHFLRRSTVRDAVGTFEALLLNWTRDCLCNFRGPDMSNQCKAALTFLFWIMHDQAQRILQAEMILILPKRMLTTSHYYVTAQSVLLCLICHRRRRALKQSIPKMMQEWCSTNFYQTSVITCVCRLEIWNIYFISVYIYIPIAGVSPSYDLHTCVCLRDL